MQEPTTDFERSLLCDADVRFGFDNYELLRTIGAFARQLQTTGGLPEPDASTTPDPSGSTAAGIDEGPSLLTLVRLAHSGGRRLVISLEDMADPRDSVDVLRI